jgi:hypothetical protein
MNILDQSAEDAKFSKTYRFLCKEGLPSEKSNLYQEFSIFIYNFIVCKYFTTSTHVTKHVPMYSG